MFVTILCHVLFIYCDFFVFAIIVDELFCFYECYCTLFYMYLQGLQINIITIIIIIIIIKSVTCALNRHATGMPKQRENWSASLTTLGQFFVGYV